MFLSLTGVCEDRLVIVYELPSCPGDLWHTKTYSSKKKKSLLRQGLAGGQ